MKIAISAESTIDLPKQLLEEFDIKTLPFTVILGDKEEYDGQIDQKYIFDYVKKTGVLPKTSAINEFQYTEHFENLLLNHDAIIHFSLSSGISSACQNAKSSMAQFENVYVIDTKSLSTGIALLAIYARILANQNLAPEQIVEEVTKQIPKVQASFIIEKLDYLYKGGRCSALKLFGANLLKIRPQIILKDGKMEPHKKFRGEYTQCVKKYVDETLAEFCNPVLDYVFITHTTINPEAVEYAKQKLKQAGFKHIYETNAGATITSHCGEGTLGILYLTK